MISLCYNWEFMPKWTDGCLEGEWLREEDRKQNPDAFVDLPHNVGEQPLHYSSPDSYTGICGYRRRLPIPEKLRGKRLFLQFDGAGHIATVYLNGKEIAEHRCGYTAFRVEITELVEYGADNRLAVKLDCTENGEIPPFGFVIDYLTYGGLYREVWLDVREQSYIEDMYLVTPSLDRLEARLSIAGEGSHCRLSVLDGERVVASEVGRDRFTIRVPAAKPWSPDSPKLYTVQAELLDPDGGVLDVQRQRVGFRTVDFRTDGLYLNGKKTFLRGLNRHQCYPGLGYAATASLQREDARILKEELQCNAVRTSHYPQSQHFIDACDELGLMVFTEIPGWQHVGDEAWKDQAVENVREMVLQYRNHPSIVLWGVRINESQDDDAFYKRTNALAHKLDPSRPTSGVRYLQKSSLLEDVYAYNDFSHTGDNAGCREKKTVTPDMKKPLLISEHNGHMFPTKSFDPWAKRQEHALRHARVLGAAMADGEHVGCFGWCMFDYATHKDFGSGDRICYHGVMDAFRNPKLAAATYASQGDAAPVLEIGSSMDIGDYPGGNVGQIYAFTNADEVELYKNDNYVASFKPKGWKGLKHAPVIIDDTIGALLESQEGFPKEKAEAVRAALAAAGKYGLGGMPLSEKARMAYVMLRYGLKYEEGVALYGKYVGNWGGEATRWRFDGKIGGKTVISRTCSPGSRLHLDVRASGTELCPGDTYDMAALRIRILDENGNVAPYAQLPLRIRASANLQIIGPRVLTAEGGMTGVYVKTVGKEGGTGYVSVEAPNRECVTIRFTIREDEHGEY